MSGIEVASILHRFGFRVHKQEGSHIKLRRFSQEPKQYPDGISHVMVNGALVVDNGVHTGALPGRALRSQ